MKAGFSSFCFKPLLLEGSMDVPAMFRWIAEQGATHLEIATLTFTPKGRDSAWELTDEPELLAALVAGAQETGVEISGICIPADFTSEDADERAAQLARAKRAVDTCARLGARYFRHDVTEWARKEADYAEFEALFPRIAELSQALADHAAPLGVTTSVENHGFFMNGSERVLRLIAAVDRPNFGATIDVGNFLCVDEEALIGTRRLASAASFVHLKDFHVRRNAIGRGPGWLRTQFGQEICGSVIGYGDLPLVDIVAALRAAGYDGYVSLEFEGNEPVLFGCETGFRNMGRILAERFA
ncbi:Sugar phosphate isomerase/epimerase [Devosia enhydra]|uniref:Sugar phosphate isomerase/epimerase n=1 Tax=Devosia enhydra TaxID=665118 RepID=A0A1K2I0Y0_9HYPH|nr:sugar phosphate isomerase/epimerase family protein [Devosia enhydra]SFZ85927.1 Sugar phosphate isomerase/epimerase [Devosia enhydra]